MKKVKLIALLSVVCISAAAFTGCYEIPEALMYASAPHISEDSELVTESMKIKEKFYDKTYVTFKPDKSVESHVSEINDIINSGNYTLKNYYFSDEDYCYWGDLDLDFDSTYPENEIGTYVDFTKEIVSNKDSWTINGSYYIDKDQKPVIDKKTYYGAYSEDIIKDGYEYYRNEDNCTFYRYTPNEFEYYYSSTPQASYGESIITGKAVIDGVEYDAEIVDYDEGFFSDEYYYEDYDVSYDDYEYESYSLLIYDDENNLTIRIIVDQDEAKASVINTDLEYADFLIYEENDDNSSVIQKPNDYIKDNEFYSGIFY